MLHVSLQYHIVVFICGAKFRGKLLVRSQYIIQKQYHVKVESEYTPWQHGQQLTGPRKGVGPPDLVAVLVGWLEDRHRARGPHTYTYAYFSYVNKRDY